MTELAQPTGSAAAWPDTYGEDAKPRMGFFTDTSICIGCKACEVACKEWNLLPMRELAWTGESYDNTSALGAETWRHVAFVEQRKPLRLDGESAGIDGAVDAEGKEDVLRWLMSSDVCKHCTHAACLDVCPTGSLFRTEFGTVVVQEDVCNGCGYCVPACPFGVLDRRDMPRQDPSPELALPLFGSQTDGRVWKCTLCYDRLKGGYEPACAKACPTDSIQFGEVDELRERADKRLAKLQGEGWNGAQLYLRDENDGIGGAGAFFLLLDEPEVYGLPPDPVVTTSHLPAMWATAFAAGAALVAGVAAAFLGGSEMSPDPRTGVEPLGSHDGKPAKTTSADGSITEVGTRMESYYGRPIIKEPVWTPEIPTYFFTGGLGGASAILSVVARATGHEKLGKAATYWGAAGDLISPPLLISDLGRPERFLNMLRVFKVTSPMSVGSWVLVVSGGASSTAALLELTGKLKPVKIAAEGVAALFGPLLSTYTATLVSNTAVPVWHEARHELPFIFGASAGASAGAACSLVLRAQGLAAPPGGSRSAASSPRTSACSRWRRGSGSSASRITRGPRASWRGRRRPPRARAPRCSGCAGAEAGRPRSPAARSSSRASWRCGSPSTRRASSRRATRATRSSRRSGASRRNSSAAPACRHQG